MNLIDFTSKKGSIFDIDFPESSIGAIHLSRVMHFFHPQEVEKFFQKAATWLVPNGRIYLSTMSPYHTASPPECKTLYEENLKKGVEWPGEFPNYSYKCVHEYLEAIDPSVITRVAAKYGFMAKRVGLFGGEFDQNYTEGIFILKF